MKGQKPLKGRRPPHMERVYVKVNSDFDATGYMQPRSITWADGRTFKIEAVKDYRPAACYRQGASLPGKCGRKLCCQSGTGCFGEGCKAFQNCGRRTGLYPHGQAPAAGQCLEFKL